MILSVDGINLHFQENGNGEAVVMLHGGAATGRYWDSVKKFLVDRYRVIAIDLYGCGITDPFPGARPPTHDDEAKLACAILDRLDTPAHLVGHSYGASSALRAALHRERDVRSLVLIEPPMYLLLKQTRQEELYREICGFRETFERRVARGEREAAMELLVDRFNGAGTLAKIPAKERVSLLDLIESLIGGFTANHDNPTRPEELQQLDIPTLLLYGEDTGAPERAMVNVLSDHLPNNRLEIIAGAKHQSPMSHPDAVAEKILDHLAEN